MRVKQMSDRMCITGQQMAMSTTGTELQAARNSTILNQIETYIYYGEEIKSILCFKIP